MLNLTRGLRRDPLWYGPCLQSGKDTGHGTAVARQWNGTRQRNQALRQARERPGLTGTVPERQRGGSDSATGATVIVAGSGDGAGPGLGYGR